MRPIPPNPRSRRPESALNSSRTLPVRRTAPPGDKRDGIMSRLNEVDAGTAKELRNANTVEDIFLHYAENGNDSYDLVSLSHALQKVTAISSQARPWKRQMVHAEDLQRLAAHTAAALREPLKKEEELKAWRIDMALKASKGDKEAEKELARTPEHSVSLRTIAASLAALSRVNLCPPSLLHEVGSSIGNRISRGEANPIDVTALAYAFSRSNVRVPQLFNKLSARALKDVNDYKEIELASLALSFTSLSTAAPALFAAISTRMIERREQTNTVTPQILCNVSVAMARSLRLDEKAPTRLLDDETIKHSSSASSTLEKLSERIESTARKHRVPIVSPNAFTAQGLSTTAWAYVRVLFATYGFSTRGGGGGSGATRLANELIQRFSHPRDAAKGIAARLIHKSSEVKFTLVPEKGIEQLKYDLKRQIQEEILISLGADPSDMVKSLKSDYLSDSSSVRVVSSLGKALVYAPTLSTATSVNIAMMAQAHADLFSLINSRLALTRWTMIELDQVMTENSSSISISGEVSVDENEMVLKRLREAVLSETLRLSGLLQMLNASSIIKTLASATIRILDPASAGGQAQFRAHIAREDVYRDKAKDVLLDKMNEGGGGGGEGVNDSGSSSLVAMQQHGGRNNDGNLDHSIDRWSGLSRGQRSGGEVREEERLSTFLNNASMKEASDDERDMKAVQTMMMPSTSSTTTSSSTRDDFTSMLQRVAGQAIDTEQERVNQSVAAGVEYKLSFNPLRQAESLALATPFSITDIASIGSSLAETAVDEPEFWSKVASYCDQNKGSVIENARPADIAQLAHAAIAVAPDSHATQILFKVASVFCTQDDAFKVTDTMSKEAAGGESASSLLLSETSRPSSNSSKVQQRLIVEDHDQVEDQLEYDTQVLDSDNLYDNVIAAEATAPRDDSTVPLRVYDEEPTWSQIEFEAEKRSKLVPKAPSRAVFRLRGDSGPGSAPIETFGLQDKEIGSRERPHVYRGTNSSWAGRMLRKSRVDALTKLSAAFTLACPVVRPKTLSTIELDTHLQDHHHHHHHHHHQANTVLFAMDQVREGFAESIASKFLPVSWLFMDETALSTSLPATKSKRWQRGLKAFNGDFSKTSSSSSSLSTLSSSLGLAYCRHLIASTSARLADRHEEIPLSRQALFLQLLLTRDYSNIDCAESLRLGLKTGASPQSVVHEAAVRRTASHLVETLMKASSPSMPLLNRAARRRALANVSSPSSSPPMNSTTQIETTEREGGGGGGGKVSKLQEPLAVYTSFCRVFGWALTDSIRSRSGCFNASITADKNIHSFLSILVEETAVRISSIDEREGGEKVGMISPPQDSKRVLKSKKKEKERTVLHLAIEVACALLPVLTIPIATRSKDAIDAVNALASTSRNSESKDVMRVAADWISSATRAALNAKDITLKKKVKKDVLGEGVSILKLMAQLREGKKNHNL